MIQTGQVDEKQIMSAASKFQKVFRESDTSCLKFIMPTSQSHDPGVGARQHMRSKRYPGMGRDHGALCLE